ncbi:MAG: NAD-dependent epimerase/dehydratase family protein [Flavobacterium sp.]|jgi:nucleoside-diphosphate-sugar epimerase|nr:NAD-dependent epimerase/dehydratase family protein [Flavobacterium sp.]
MILVTGGTGLVGAHLLLHLVEQGENARAIYRSTTSIEKTKNLFSLYNKSHLFEKIEWMEADILDIPSLEIAFQNIEFVYHCAALISFDPKDEEAIRKTNIEGTANIVNFSLSYKIKKMLFVSSIAALGDLNTAETSISETTEWNPEKPHSDYAISKYGAEMEVWRGQQEGLSVLIVNPGVIIGPGFPEQGSGALFSAVAKGLSFYTLGTTGFIAVTDVVETSVRLMKSDIQNERFTLIENNYSFQEILNCIADSLQVNRPRWQASPLVMEIIWRIDWFLSVFFFQKRKLSRASAKASYSKSVYANAKIKAVLQSEFTAIKEYITTISYL